MSSPPTGLSESESPLPMTSSEPATAAALAARPPAEPGPERRGRKPRRPTVAEVQGPTAGRRRPRAIQLEGLGAPPPPRLRRPWRPGPVGPRANGMIGVLRLSRKAVGNLNPSRAWWSRRNPHTCKLSRSRRTASESSRVTSRTGPVGSLALQAGIHLLRLARR